MTHSNTFLIESKASFTDDLGYMAEVFYPLYKFKVEFDKIGACHKIHLKYIYTR